MGNPAMQTIKKEQEYRSCFRSQLPNSLIFTYDYGGQEVLVATENSKDPLWIQFNKDNKNIHLEMGHIIWGKPITKGTTEYSITKNLNFAIVYGAGIYKVIMFFNENGLSCTEEHAQSILDRIQQAIPVAWKQFHFNGVNAIFKGYSESLIGFKRWFDVPDYKTTKDKVSGLPVPFSYDKEDNKKIRKIIRESRNHVIQSTGSSMVKKALIFARREFKQREMKVPFILAVHDETVSESKDDKEQVSHIIIQSMLKAEKEILPSVNGKVEGGYDVVWTK